MSGKVIAPPESGSRLIADPTHTSQQQLLACIPVATDWGARVVSLCEKSDAARILLSQRRGKLQGANLGHISQKVRLVRHGTEDYTSVAAAQTARPGHASSPEGRTKAVADIGRDEIVNRVRYSWYSW